MVKITAVKHTLMNKKKTKKKFLSKLDFKQKIRRDEDKNDQL